MSNNFHLCFSGYCLFTKMYRTRRAGICSTKLLICKVNIFWEGHKLFSFDYEMSRRRGRFIQIFVAFSKNLNFKTYTSKISRTDGARIVSVSESFTVETLRHQKSMDCPLHTLKSLKEEHRFFRFSFHPARNFSCNKRKIPPPRLLIYLVALFSKPASLFWSALLLWTSQ